MKCCVVFDIDGVLIDSYKGVPVFYTRILPEKFGIPREMGFLLYLYEMFAEGLGLLRIDWWRKKIPWIKDDEMRRLLDEYWKARINYSTLIPGAKTVLNRLRGKGYVVSSVSYMDDIPGLKYRRMEIMGLVELFDDIVIVGENAGSRVEGIEEVARKRSCSRVFYVDDKPGNLLEIKNRLPWVITVNHRFVVEHGYSWMIDVDCDYRVNNLFELVNIVDTVCGKTSEKYYTGSGGGISRSCSNT